MKADINTQPAENKLYTSPGFSFMLRLGNWMWDNKGLHRWWTFKANKAMKNGRFAIRYGWKRVL